MRLPSSIMLYQRCCLVLTFSLIWLNGSFAQNNNDASVSLGEEQTTSIGGKPHLAQQSLGERSAKPFYMAVKTNFLLDIIATPNIGVELYLGRKWSVAAN